MFQKFQKSYINLFCNRKILVLFFLITTAYSALSQDIIYKNNGEKIKAKISTITPDEIVYKIFDYPDGPEIRLLKELVFRIEYANGTTEIVNHDESVLSRYSTAEDLRYKGELDAIVNYKGYKPSGTGTFVATLLGGPAFGLVIAIPATLSKPKIKNLNFPDTKLFEKYEYRNGYQRRAYKIKAKRIWVNFFVGTAIFSSIYYLATRE